MASDQNKLWGIGLTVLIPLAVIGIAFAVFIAVKLYRVSNPYLDREISGPVTLTSEWIEIVPEEPLRPEREVQKILLDFAQPYESDHDAWKIRFPDGSLVAPEVQLIDKNGNVFTSSKVASLGQTGMGLRMSSLPQDRVYLKLRLRSDKPIAISRIIWRCYDPRDRK